MKEMSWVENDTCAGEEKCMQSFGRIASRTETPWKT
jgi:hypothetical protein